MSPSSSNRSLTPDVFLQRLFLTMLPCFPLPPAFRMPAQRVWWPPTEVVCCCKEHHADGPACLSLMVLTHSFPSGSASPSSQLSARKLVAQESRLVQAACPAYGWQRARIAHSRMNAFLEKAWALHDFRAPRTVAGHHCRYTNHSKYLNKLKCGVRLMKNDVLSQALENSRAKTVVAENEQLVRQGKVVLVMDANHAGTDKEPEFWRQGDTSMYTTDALRQRQALRKHPQVREVLQRFWHTAVVSLQLGKDAVSEIPCLPYEGYAAMMQSIYHTLLQAGDAEEADESILQDWLRDSQGHETITRELMMDALFELVDIWARGIGADEYTGWLDGLLDKVTTHFVQVDQSGKVLWEANIWKGVEDCAFDEEAYGDGPDEDKCDGEDEVEAEVEQSVPPVIETVKVKKREEKAQTRAAAQIQAIHRGRSARNMLWKRAAAVRLIGRIAKGVCARKWVGTDLYSVSVKATNGRSKLYESSLPTPGTPGVKQRWAIRKRESPIRSTPGGGVSPQQSKAFDAEFMLSSPLVRSPSSPWMLPPPSTPLRRSASAAIESPSDWWPMVSPRTGNVRRPASEIAPDPGGFYSPWRPREDGVLVVLAKELLDEHRSGRYSSTLPRGAWEASARIRSGPIRSAGGWSGGGRQSNGRVNPRKMPRKFFGASAPKYAQRNPFGLLPAL